MRRTNLALGHLAALLLGLAALVVFGAAAFVGRGFNPHFLGFIVLGLLAGAHGVLARANGPGRSEYG